jgi:hypothetical protein
VGEETISNLRGQFQFVTITDRLNDRVQHQQRPATLFFPFIGTITVKAFNFGPHGNFGLFLPSSVASVDESFKKMNRTEFVDLNFSEVFLQLLFSSFFCRTRFNDSKLF